MGEQFQIRRSPNRYVEVAQLENGKWIASTSGPDDQTRQMIADDPVEAVLMLCDLLYNYPERHICCECGQYST